jgi:hypothetical protein
MAFTKTYNGEGSGATAGDYGDSRNWELNSLRNEYFAWTASGSGTNEYYVRTAANANPGFAASPPTSNGVYINSAVATKGVLGSLAAGEWGYGDNDTLGYSTVYVRLSGGGDPDVQLNDHVQFRQIPQTAENVRVPATAGSITSNLDQSAVAINGFYVEPGYQGTIGVAASSTSPPKFLRIDPNVFEFSSRSQAWIDVGNAAITATVHDTAAFNNGEYGLYLRGSALTLLEVRGGAVGLAALPGDASTLTTLRVNGDRTIVKCGAGTSLTTLQMYTGTVWLHCNATTITKYGGICWLQEASAVTTVNNLAGEFHWGSSGNVGTYNARGGVLNLRASMAARTLSTLNRYQNGGQIIHNKEAVTITTNTLQDSFTETMGA